MTDLEIKALETNGYDLKGLSELVPLLEKVPELASSSLDKVVNYLDTHFVKEFSDRTRVLLWIIAIGLMVTLSGCVGGENDNSPDGTAVATQAVNVDAEISGTQNAPAGDAGGGGLPLGNSGSIERQAQNHTVRPGENLYRISLQYGVSIEDLVKANNIANRDLIWAGMVLVIPAQVASVEAPQAFVVQPTPLAVPQALRHEGRVDLLGQMIDANSYCVDEGDTLSEIALRFGVTVDQLMTWNGLSSASYIQMGQVLYISQP